MSSGEVSTRTKIDFVPLAPQQFSVFGRKHDLAAGRARRGRQAGRDDLALGVGIDGRMQELVERSRIDARHRLLFADQFLPRQFDGDAQRGLGGALAVAGLQHPQLALLHREFEVLHVAVMLFQRGMHALELGEGLRHRLFHRGFVGAHFLARFLGDFLWRANAGDHVLALRIDEEFAVEFLLAGRRIAGKGDAGRRRFAHIAEHHGLHIHRRAPVFRNGMQAAIGDGTLVHPRAEHGPDRAPQLRVRVLRERRADLLVDALLEARDHLLQVGNVEIGIERITAAILVLVEDFLKVMVRDAEHHVRIHGDEAPVAVIGETLVAGFFRQRRDGHVVEPEIEHSIHHSRHRRARSRAHRDQERIFAVAKSLSGDATDLGESRLDLRLQILRIDLAVVVKVRADLGGNGEAGRHRKAERSHLGEARAFAAEQIAHTRATRPLAAAECVDPFALLAFGYHGQHRARFCRACGVRAARRRPLRLLHGLRGDFRARLRHWVSFALRRGRILNADAGCKCNARRRAAFNAS